MAKVYNKMRSLEMAIESQQKAMDTFARLEKYADTDYLAQIVMTLSEF